MANVFDVTIPSRERPRRGVARGSVIVIGVAVLILISLAAPAVYQSNVAARRLRCEQRLTELGKAMLRYESVHEQFPGYRNEQPTDSAERRLATGWAFPVLPYLGAESGNTPNDRLQSIFDDSAASAPAGQRGEQPRVYLFELVCPAIGARAEPVLSYVANSGMPDADQPPFDVSANGPFLDRFRQDAVGVSRAYLEEHDGADSTLLFSENVDAGFWVDDEEARVGFVWVPHLENGEPTRGDRLLAINELRGRGSSGEMRFARPSSHHGRGVNSLFASGKTAYLDESIDYLVLVQFMTPDDGGTSLPGSGEPAPVPYRTVRVP